MPKKFEDMVKGIWDSIKGKINPKTKKPFSESDAYAMATAKWKEMGHKAPSHEALKDWKVVEFFVPINEATSVGNDFIIKGTAINETTTRNGIKYIAKELENAAPSFNGKPILLDHKNEVRNIVGRISNTSFNADKKSIDFEAKIMDKEIQHMINDGRITDVSIGAKVQDLLQNKDTKEVTAVGIEGLEISLVAVPGDPGANLASAFENSLILREKFNESCVGSEEEEECEEEVESETEEKLLINEQMATCPSCGKKFKVEIEKKEEKYNAKIKEKILVKIN